MKFIKLILLFLLCCNTINAQPSPPYWEDIQAFKKQDADSMPPKNAILFVGSSSFTKWTDVQDYFPKHTIINRGFGGSTLVDVIRYANDIIIPYQPKQIIIYCGENDLAYSDTITSVEVFNRFKQLFGIIRSSFSKTPIAFISLKPSPSRKHLMLKMVETNLFIETFLKRQKHTEFIDVYHNMVDDTGEPLKDIFLEDNLHMNAKGYHIWQKSIQPHLIKTNN